MDSLDMAAGAIGAGHSEMTFWALFLRADMVVKTVMVSLVLGSLRGWAVILNRTFMLRRVAKEADKFEEVFWSGVSLEDLFQRLSARPSHPMEVVFVLTMKEWQRSLGNTDPARGNLAPGLRERIEKVMSVTINRELTSVEGRLSHLATIGAAAPFVGLFGTVWGIMNSFSAIAVSKNTTLAVVAPGIAEALFATALGLGAAIPAVIAYNQLSKALSNYATRLEGFADEFSAILSRQLDERG